MLNTECPCCNKETITLTQKLLANKWIDIYCSDCNTRFCAQPAVLAVMSFLLVWDFLYFGFLLATEGDAIFAILLFALWALIEAFMFYIPLARLRAKSKPDASS